MIIKNINKNVTLIGVIHFKSKNQLDLFINRININCITILLELNKQNKDSILTNKIISSEFYNVCNKCKNINKELKLIDATLNESLQSYYIYNNYIKDLLCNSVDLIDKNNKLFNLYLITNKYFSNKKINLTYKNDIKYNNYIKYNIEKQIFYNFKILSKEFYYSYILYRESKIFSSINKEISNINKKNINYNNNSKSNNNNSTLIILGKYHLLKYIKNFINNN